MSIQTVVDLVETKLKEDPTEWGKELFWNNLDSFQNDYAESELPVTSIALADSDMIESSTQSDYTTWEFTIKGVFWTGDKITTKPNLNEYLRLKDSLTDIYNNILNDLDCAWTDAFLSTRLESIDQRMAIIGRFTITIQTIR